MLPGKTLSKLSTSVTATVVWALSHTFPIDFYLVLQFLKFIFSPIKKYYNVLA